MILLQQRFIHSSLYLENVEGPLFPLFPLNLRPSSTHADTSASKMGFNLCLCGLLHNALKPHFDDYPVSLKNLDSIIFYIIYCSDDKCKIRVFFLQKIGKIGKRKKKEKQKITHTLPPPKEPQPIVNKSMHILEVFSCLCLALRIFPAWSQLDFTTLPLCWLLLWGPRLPCRGLYLCPCQWFFSDHVNNTCGCKYFLKYIKGIK